MSKSGWCEPAKDWIELNVDASFVQELDECSICCVARNSEGNDVWACKRLKVKCQDIF
jgi:hypothetical protein